MSGPVESRVVDRYVLYGEIASGGMASVHLGRLMGPVGFSRTVAIKRLHPSYARDPEFVSMFLDEARLAARIRHPNVVPTLDVVATHGELFLVMEYVQGESVASLVKAVQRTQTRVPTRIALSILAGTLQGLHAAHEARDEQGMSLGLVHRDVSPQNIIVGVDGMARVFDFGVAKAAGRAQNTREGVLKGKLAYMAPEQINLLPIDRAADVYAASIVLWELLTGARLFRADSEGELLALRLARQVQPPSSVVPDLPAELDAVVMRGLAKEREGRFPTAREMALALDRVGTASLGEVAEWLESVAGSTLAKRADQVSAVERQRPSIPDGILPLAHAADDPTARGGPSSTRDSSAPSSAGPGAQVVETHLGAGVTGAPLTAVPVPRHRPVQGPMLAALLAAAALGGATIAVSVGGRPAIAPAAQAQAPVASAAPTAPALATSPSVPATGAVVDGPDAGAPRALGSASSAPTASPGLPPKPTPQPPHANRPKSPFDLGGRD
jgi:serine/threonine-protein kinase